MHIKVVLILRFSKILIENENFYSFLSNYERLRQEEVSLKVFNFLLKLSFCFSIFFILIHIFSNSGDEHCL